MWLQFPCFIMTYRSNDKLCLHYLIVIFSPLRQKGRGEQEKEEVRQGVTQQKYPLVKNKNKQILVLNQYFH